jgi:hypothetical protein
MTSENVSGILTAVEWVYQLSERPGPVYREESKSTQYLLASSPPERLGPSRGAGESRSTQPWVRHAYRQASCFTSRTSRRQPRVSLSPTRSQLAMPPSTPSAIGPLSVGESLGEPGSPPVCFVGGHEACREPALPPGLSRLDPQSPYGRSGRCFVTPAGQDSPSDIE